MTNNIYDFIFKENILTNTECELALAEVEDLNWEIHSWQKNSKDGNYETFKRNSPSELYVGYIQKNSNLHYILEKSINKAITMYTEKFPYCDVLNHYPPRINKYPENTKMKEHVDHINGIFDGKRRGIPIISIVGTLNDNYTGGEFIFNDEYNVNFKAGDILIFPSVFLYKHKVKSIVDGTRFSFVSWGY